MIPSHAHRHVGRIVAAFFSLAIAGIAPSAFAAAPQSFEGTLQVQVEDHASQRGLTHYYLVQNGRRLELRNVQGAPGATSGSKIRARGTLTGNVLALDTSGSSNLVATALADLNYAAGVQNVAVILVNFSDDVVQPVTAATVQGAVFGTTSNFLRENSGERTWLSGSVLGWYTVPMSKASCDPAQIATLADQAASAAGANLSAYSRKFYVFPKNACTWAGLADVGGASTKAWFNGKFDLDNFGHEFGHNLGLMHSHGLDCDVSALGNTCTPLSYGDAADIMGNMEGHYNGFQKERLGWLSGLTTVSASGRYTLVPYEAGNGTRVLKIPRGVDSSGRQTWYYLEYRQPVAFDSGLGYYGTLAKGVLVRTATSTDADSSYLLDMTPNSDTSSGFVDLWDSALMAGSTYSDAAAKFSVSLVSADTNGAVLDITVASGGGGGTAPATQLSETVATSKAVYKRGEVVGLGAQLLNNGSAVNGATVTFTVTRPNGSTTTISASTGSNGGASASYRMSKQKDPAGSYSVRAQSTWGGQSISAASGFTVQ